MAIRVEMLIFLMFVALVVAFIWVYAVQK